MFETKTLSSNLENFSSLGNCSCLNPTTDDFCFWIQTSFTDFVCNTIFSCDFKERTSNINIFVKEKENIFTAAYVVRGKVLFSQVSVCSHLWEIPPSPGTGRGVPPSQVQVGGTPFPGPGWGSPSQFQVGGTPSQVQAGTPGWEVVPPTWEGIPPTWEGGLHPHLGSQDSGGYPYWSTILWTCYAAGGVPLAFMQEDFLVQPNLKCSLESLSQGSGRATRRVCGKHRKWRLCVFTFSAKLLIFFSLSFDCVGGNPVWICTDHD